MRPFGCRAAASPKSSPPKFAVAMPAVPYVASSPPAAVSRAALTSPVSGPEKPARMILPLGSDHGHGAAQGAPREGQLAVARERRVERSVGVQPSDGDAEVAVAREQDLPVGLQRRAEHALVLPAEADPLLAAGAERRVQEPVALQARDAERGARPAEARDEDPAVGLHEHRGRSVGAAEVDRLLPVAGEARVEVAGGHGSEVFVVAAVPVVVLEAEEQVRVLDIGVERIGVRFDHVRVVGGVRRLVLAP
jgi:hypothetical protein